MGSFDRSRWLTAVATMIALGCGDSADGGAGADAGGLGAPTEGTRDGAQPEAGDVDSRVVMNGYVTAGPWMGSGFTATDPGAATITPDCSGAGCLPAYAGPTFCMKGTVTGRADYTGFAMLGWNVNQSVAGAPMTWSVPETGSVAVTVENRPPTVALRVQLQGTDPHSSADRWCAALENGKPIAWGDFKTNCWQGGTPQNPLTPGTMIQQGSVIVPGLTKDLPFDVCLVDIVVTP